MGCKRLEFARAGQPVHGCFIDPGKVFGLENLPDLDRLAALERTVREPLDEFFLRARLQDPKAGYEFLGFGEWTVGDDGRGPA